ncbi:MAG: glycosyltransferase family 2 protein [Brevibacterium sp.]
MPHFPRLSVVVPVYNAGRFLPAFVDSFLKQTISAEAVELVAVDDGSTDESSRMLDELADSYAHISVIHQENSGWPGKPRNVGISASNGKYVFFADPDDEFGGPEALERLVDFADEHDSDVVIPKMVPRGNRLYSDRPYSETQVDADLDTCFATLTPQKLFRRAFLNANGIRFPERQTSLEDGQFVSRAYVQAGRVSILADYDYYYLIHHPDHDHLSFRPKSPKDYVSAITVMCANIEEFCGDEDVADQLINDLYYRKVLLNFRRSRLLDQRVGERRSWLKNQRIFADRFIGERRYRKLHEVAQARTGLVREGDADRILEYVMADQIEFKLESAKSRRGNVELKGTLSGLTYAGELPTLAVAERGQSEHSIEIPLNADGQMFIAEIPKSALPPTDNEKIYDLWLTAGSGHPKRRIRNVGSPFTAHFSDNRNIDLYTTKKGKLSLTVNPGLSLSERVRRRLRRRVRL